MHPKLETVMQEFGTAQARLHNLAATVPTADWPRRPDPQRWSVAECVAHLNLTSAAFVPLVRGALAEGRSKAPGGRTRVRRDLVGWLLWRVMGPPARLRMKTTAPFVPQSTAAAAALVAEFDTLQAQQMACVREAEGMPLGRIWVTSPFSRVRYNLYSCLTILPRHQHRHLWQAEQVWAALQRT